MSAPAIEVDGLVKEFGTRRAVDGVTLSVARGEIAGFLGPNGAGKTTTIRVICGLLTPDEGEGRVLGHDIRREARAIKWRTGYMTQHFSYYTDLTVAENLGFVAGLYGLAPVAAHVARAMDRFGLTARRDQLAGTLSGGWKQRLALAASVIHGPDLLLLDEPTAGVDPRARRSFWAEIHDLAQSGVTVLVSTHYTDEAERCHRINYVLGGRIVASGTVEQVMETAGLTTLVLDGPQPALAEAARRLAGAPGVEQTAHFGTRLHVVGRDGAALTGSTEDAARALGLTVQPAATSLEDVFIHLVGHGPEQ